MAATNLKNVTGFYYMINSNDYPANYNPNLPFGFSTTGKETPVFSYSINQIKASFLEPREFLSHAYYNNQSSNVVILEQFNNKNLGNQNIFSNEWIGIFRIIEWAYMNQSIINIQKPVDEGYKTFANERLGATRINNEENIYYVQNYVAGSFTYETSAKMGRLAHIMFKAIVNNEQVYFDIYLDPDIMMTERVTKDAWAIYAYEDETWNDKINESEWENNIVKKLWELNKGKDYTRVDKFITTWCRENPSVPGGWEEGVQRLHFLFNYYPTTPANIVTREMLKNKIKEWVLKKNNNNYEYSAKEYPELFSDQQVLIVPVYDNFRRGSDGQDEICHCLSKEKLEKVINRFFNESVMLSTDRLEIFHIGSDGTDQPSREAYIYPFVAGEMTVDDTVTYPISSRFPKYFPRIFDSGFRPGNEHSENFQFILLKVIGYFDKKYDESSLKNLEPAEEVEIRETTPAELGFVRFKYRGCEFKVMAPWEGMQTGTI